MYKFEKYILRKQHMIDKTHLNLEGAKLYFFLYFYWELVLGTMFFWVCVQ